jgi:hypothetical protein
MQHGDQCDKNVGDQNHLFAPEHHHYCRHYDIRCAASASSCMMIVCPMIPAARPGIGFESAECVDESTPLSVAATRFSQCSDAGTF